MELKIELEPTHEAPRRARLAVRKAMADVLPAVTLYDLLTIISELVANGVRHGAGGPVRVQVGLNPDGSVRGQVESPGSGRVELRPIDGADERGLGLHIVDALADWWHAAVADTTRVCFELSG